MSVSDIVATEGGFADPVFDAQAVFSGIMTAFSRPGTVVDLRRCVRAPLPIPPATAGILAALADLDTPVWLDDAAEAAGLGAWVSFQTGAPLTRDRATASFAVLSDGGNLQLDRFCAGTPEYPDRSATMIVALDSLEGGARLVLTGPGIETEAMIEPRGLGDNFLGEWAENNAQFPRGIDVVLISGSRMLALPRTTRIRSA